MAETLTDRSCEEFARILAAKEPVPGGGGAAALVGALGVALASMVGNYTLGKKAYAGVEPGIVRLLAEAEAVRRRLLGLVQEDADAFLPLSRAYALPRDDAGRPETIEAATKAACAAPLAMMREIAHAIEILEEMGGKGSHMLASDVACGAFLSRAALEAASVNVLVNTTSLEDRAFAECVEAECDELIARYVPRAEACAQAIVTSLRA